MSDRSYRVWRRLLYPAFGVSSAPVVLHVERTSAPGPFILAANHLSPYDVPCIMAATPRPLDWLSIVEMLRSPFVGWFFRQFNTFFVDRGKLDTAAARTILGRLERGRVIAMFPEAAIRSEVRSVIRGAPFRPGVVKIAQMADVPIVPCVVLGTDAYRRPWNWLPLRRVKYGVAFGRPLRARKDLDAREAREMLAGEMRQAYLDLNAELRRAMGMPVMNSSAPSDHDVRDADGESPPAAVAPHPPIEGYYERPAEKRQFVRRLFDESAGDYDRVESLMSFGSGSWYRRQALRRAGLGSGMRTLDVAVGTGLVAREAAALVGETGRVVGIDPSAGMLAEAARAIGCHGGSSTISLVAGRAENLPVGAGGFDFLSMGYALRHVADLSTTFQEFFRALKPGATVCVLEITRPTSRLALTAMRWYMKGLVPRLSGLTRLRRKRSGAAGSRRLWEYYWDTIEACVPPERVMDAMRAAGFADVRRHVELGIFSEYTARRP